MWEDPIVEEVHRTREKLAAEYNFDVKAIFADLRKRQASLESSSVALARRAQVFLDGHATPWSSLGNSLCRA
jgi:hypothetical protein